MPGHQQSARLVAWVDAEAWRSQSLETSAWLSQDHPALDVGDESVDTASGTMT